MKLFPARSKLHYLVALSLFILPVSVVAGPCKAAEYDKVSELFAAGLKGQDITRQAYVTGLSTYLRQNGMPINELTKADIDKVKRRALAYLRMKRVSLVLVADLDGDGIVTKNELTEYLSTPGTQIYVDDPRFITSLMNIKGDKPPTPQEYVLERMDRNKDGKVSYDEMRYIPDENMVFSSKDADSVRMKILTGLLEQDPNKDGKLTLAEAETLAGQAFDIIDLNKDAILQKSEVDAYYKATKPAPQTNQ